MHRCVWEATTSTRAQYTINVSGSSCKECLGIILVGSHLVLVLVGVYALACMYGQSVLRYRKGMETNVKTRRVGNQHL